ncbi:MAG: RNA-binding transcriptional accessory protein [Clostridia bacterium]|nr:RNA-binding transcriptional accessory protein [Clostridia bacterium]
MEYSKLLANEFNIREPHAVNIIALINEGNTIPFIARYRKEMTGSCDDQVLREIADRYEYLLGLVKRKEEVVSSITEQGKFTDEIRLALESALTLAEVEDIYRPYKQKRKTRASVAIEKGLQPLAELILAENTPEILKKAATFINAELGVNNVEDAVNGAKDIIAEIISDDAAMRKTLREYMSAKSEIKSQLAKKEETKVFEMYADYSESVATIPSHRILAINRGESEGVLKVAVVVDAEFAINSINKKYVKGSGISSDYIKEAIDDSYKRLIFPSLEREIRTMLTEKADEQAIKMFEVNLRPLLLQPPLRGKVVLALDPAYRTGCKVAVVNANGDVLATGVVYPTPPQSAVEDAEDRLMKAIDKFGVEVISIGNGTASKETEIFAAGLIKKCKHPVSYIVVNEAGASVYSASKLGAEEFPQFDVSLRSAVSIARRLQDPLAELIKIDVKSIGVGQYQHDMPQKRLTEVLEGVVEDCVNKVGVELNTASYSLLTYVAGLNKSIAKSIVEYRAATPFKKRSDLMKVPKLGAKAYEQCAGFLRISKGENILDNTGVHPESYAAVGKLLSYFGYSAKQLADGELGDLMNKVHEAGIAKVATACGVGTPTLNDIIVELMKPGRDVRDSLPAPILRKDLLDIGDLKEGMEIVGTVRNVIDFGAFVDIGVHQDGLVHISQITDKYIKHPSEVLKVGDIVTVRVISVDKEKKKISLTMRGDDVG